MHRIPSRLMVLVTAAGLLAACADFYNRCYRYHEEIPLSPFVMKLVQAEFSMKNGQAIVKVSVQVANRSTEKSSLSRDRFVLRVAGTTEVARDQSLFESLGFDCIPFSPGEEKTVVVPFVIARQDLASRLDLIVERLRIKKQKHVRTTLVEIKQGGSPSILPVEGEWRRVQTARW